MHEDRENGAPPAPTTRSAASGGFLPAEGGAPRLEEQMRQLWIEMGRIEGSLKHHAMALKGVEEMADGHYQRAYTIRRNLLERLAKAEERLDTLELKVRGGGN